MATQFTFYRKDCVRPGGAPLSFPHAHVDARPERILAPVLVASLSRRPPRAMARNMNAIRKVIRKLSYRMGPYVPGSTRPEALDSMLSMLRPLAIPEGLIRIGNSADGGYLLPDNLDGIAACFSPGVGALAPFELDMAQRGVRSFMADGSVDAPPAAHALFSFERKFLGTVNDARHIRLEDWVQRSVPDDSGDLLLQMDIEGGEYAVLADAPASVLARFRIMVIEFHRLYRCFREKRHKLIGGVFEKLASEFSVVHIHPNNNGAVMSNGRFDIPHVLEFTFYRKNCVRPGGAPLRFPHALDVDNAPGRPAVILPSCWR